MARSINYVVHTPNGHHIEVVANDCYSALVQAANMRNFDFFWRCPTKITSYYYERAGRDRKMWTVTKKLA